MESQRTEHRRPAQENWSSNRDYSFTCLAGANSLVWLGWGKCTDRSTVPEHFQLPRNSATYSQQVLWLIRSQIASDDLGDALLTRLIHISRLHLGLQSTQTKANEQDLQIAGRQNIPDRKGSHSPKDLSRKEYRRTSQVQDLARSLYPARKAFRTSSQQARNVRAKPKHSTVVENRRQLEVEVAKQFPSPNLASDK